MPALRSLAVVAASLAVTGALATACSSSSAQSGSPVLAGGYVSNSGGSILELDFDDATHYHLWTSPCPSGGTAACSSSGTYVLNGAQDTLTLTDASGTVTALPFQVVATAPGGTTQSLEPRNTPLTSDGGSTLYKPIGLLIQTFKVLEHVPAALYASFVHQTPTDMCQGQCFCNECGTGWSCNYCEGDGGCVINFPCDH